MSARGLTVSEVEASSGIAMSRRGETLSVEEFDDLAFALAGGDRDVR
jgi:hypothetical protein